MIGDKDPLFGVVGFFGGVIFRDLLGFFGLFGVVMILCSLDADELT